MLRDGDAFASLRTQWFHGTFEQQVLPHQRVQRELAPAVVVLIDLVQLNVDLVAALWTHVLGTVEGGEREVHIERDLSQAPCARRGHPSGELRLNEHIQPGTLGVHSQSPVLGPWTQLGLSERRGQPIRADGKVPIPPGLVEVLDL